MIGRPEHLSALIEQTTSSKEPQFAEQALVSILTSEKEGGQGIKEIVRAYRSGLGGDASRGVLIRVLGQTGGVDAMGVLEEALSAPSVELRKAAATALGLRTRNDVVKIIAERFPQESDPACRLIALASATNTVTQTGSLPQASLFGLAKKLYDAAKDQREKDQAVAVMARVLDSGAAAFFEALAISEPSRKSASETISKRIREGLEKVISVGTGETLLSSSQADYSKIGGLAIAAGALTNWLMPSDFASWDVHIDQAGDYEISISQASSSSQEGKYEVTIAGVRHETAVVKTGAVDDFKSFVIGKASIAQPGIYRLWLRPVSIPENEPLFRVQSMALRKL
jgi:hypothetical protein